MNREKQIGSLLRILAGAGGSLSVPFTEMSTGKVGLGVTAS